MKDSPLCTKDSMFTKGKIPKSKVTIKLIDKLVSQKTLLVEQNEKGKTVYYVKGTIPSIENRFDIFKDEVDFLKKYASHIVRDSEFLHHPDLTAKIVTFLRTRAKILEREKKLAGKIDVTDTRRIISHIVAFRKNPTKLSAKGVMSILSWTIENDEYYLKHQLHSTPRENEYPFQESKKRHIRRSMTDLVSMKEKGRHEFSLAKRDYEKHMDKLKDDDGNYDHIKWLRRLCAETDRVLYHNSPELKTEISRKIFTKEFIARTEAEKRLKPFFDEYRKTFPKIPIKVLLECLCKDSTERLKTEFREMGSDFETMKNVVIKFFDNADQNTSRSSLVSP